MTDRAGSEPGLGRKWSRAAASATTAAGLIAISILNAPSIHAQAGSVSSPPAFEVASVKLWKDDGVSPRNSRSTYGPQGIDFGARTLGFVIGEAYRVPVGLILAGSHTNDFRQGYDIVAKADHAVPKEQLRFMLQSLLADRFKLTLHRETRMSLVYRLVVAKGGPKLEESEGGDLVMSGSPNGFVFRNAEVFRLTGYLSSYADRIVVDETGLKGLYNFAVKMPEDLRQNSPVKSDGRSPESGSADVFAEVLRPLGLRLIAGTDRVEYLVIDHVERPSAN
jgi:bla regulator protein BlaR1